MDAESLVTALVRLQLAASAAILVVLLLRPLALRWCGAGTAYWLWIVVPLAAMAVLLPAREQVVINPTAPDIPILQQDIEPDLVVRVKREYADTPPAVQPGIPDDGLRSGLLITLWLLGAGVFLIRSIVNTRRLASSPSIGPALVGVLRPRLVLPHDFEARFNAEERTLILAHEEMHRVSRHTLVNALVEVARCASWFNPLAHLAAWRFRADQELACDTAVIAIHPEARHTYAEALLKTQVAGAYLPMGCVWTSGTAGRLAERITRLSEQLPGRRRRFVGAASIVGIGIATGYAAWAQQPAQVITVQPPNPHGAAAVSTDVPAPEAREAVRAAIPPAASLGRPPSAPVPVRAPLDASSTAADGKPEAPDANFGTRTLTVIDGIPVVSSSNPTDTIDLSVIPSNLVQRMNEVTGGSSATYGSDAMRGVVNLALSNLVNSPAAEFASESVDEEWSSRKRNEIIESMTLLEGVVSTAQIDCRSSSCRVELKWPKPATEESEDQRRQRENRIAMWAQEVSKRSGFLRGDTGWVASQSSSLSYFTMKPISSRPWAEIPRELSPEAAESFTQTLPDSGEQLRQPPAK
ncbi:MAG: M56 family metallopeptidase [Steroidobacteraceae bacterium]